MLKEAPAKEGRCFLCPHLDDGQRLLLWLGKTQSVLSPEVTAVSQDLSDPE